MLKKLYIALLIVVVTLFVAACGAPPAAEPAEKTASVEEPAAKEAAETSNEPAITVVEPFARASIPNGAAYMTIMNEGGSDDTLLSAETDVAETVELHETTIGENDVMQMKPVENIPVPAGGSATLEPGSKHVMLMGLQAGLAVGDTFDLTLNFEKSGSQTVQVEITEGITMEHNMEHNMEADDAEHGN